MGVEDSLFTLHEIIERTFYIALLHETLKRGLTLNPEDYLVDIPGESVPSPTAETLKFLQNLKNSKFLKKLNKKKMLQNS